MEKHFVVIDEKFNLLMRGKVLADRSVLLTYRYNAPEKHVSESYSDFDAVLVGIPAGTLPTIQFGDEGKLNEFV